MHATPALLEKFKLLRSLTSKILVFVLLFLENMLGGIVLRAPGREDRICFLFEGRLQGINFTIDGKEAGLYFVEEGDYCGNFVSLIRACRGTCNLTQLSGLVYFSAETIRTVAKKIPKLFNSRKQDGLSSQTNATQRSL